MSRLRDDSGLTLMELIVSMAIMTVVLGATLTVLEVMQRQNAVAVVRVDNRDLARTVMDRLLKPLRGAVETSAGLVESVGDFDLVWQAVGSTSPSAGDVNATGLQRNRLCLDTTANRLYLQTQTWTGATPAIPTALCGVTGTGYTAANTKVVGTNVVNGASRPLFTYDYRSGSTALKDLLGVKASIYADTNATTKDPPEVRLTTGISLRNVNQPPTASATFAKIPGHALFNASSSSDPEGGSLTYAWYLDGAANPAGTDIRYDAAGLLPASHHEVTLIVTDSAGVPSAVWDSLDFQMPG